SDMSDENLGRQLATDLPRYQAPAAVRARVRGATRPVSRRGVWFTPTLAALATAAVFVLAVLPTLPRTTPSDAVQRLVNVVVAERVWREGDLACFVVSDLVADSDLAAFKDYFVRVRTATEPNSSY